MAKDKTDSEIHTENRRAKIREESERLSAEATAIDEEREAQTVKRNAKITREDADNLEHHAGLVRDNETREELLERVRQMREEKPAGPPAPLGKTPFMEEVISIEQQAGRDAVARREAEIERFNENRRKQEAETLAREGHMSAVHHPNPGMHEQFPAEKATLGKTK